MRLRVVSYRPAYFRFAGKIKVDPDYETEKVLAAVESALRDAIFVRRRAVRPAGFLERSHCGGSSGAGRRRGRRRQPLSHRQPRRWTTRLLAELPNAGDGSVGAAELLTLDPAPLDDWG